MFKRLLGKPDETLRVFLNDVLKLNIVNVEDITIENSEIFVEHANQKTKDGFNGKSCVGKGEDYHKLKNASLYEF